ncbi:alpha/beta hydrolase [Lysobacteraceae bacterium NML07-0707]|nr:alpha/beta hydrolase [Xanthomonadaceae bacterium NML07-0707]
MKHSRSLPIRQIAMKPLALALPLATLLLLAACNNADKTAPGSEQAAYRLGSLAFEPCTLANAQINKSIAAQCTTLQVPENPDAPDGRKIGLRIAWVQADNPAAAEPDPIFMLAGGPGQSAIQSFPQVQMAFADVLKNRHVILLDQRGTGSSNLLACPQDDERAQQNTPEAMRTMAQACVQTLSQKADLRYYTSTDAVRDLDTVRQAIGAEKINLMGISYGTRVAQQYALRYPQHTRTLVLDSVVPNTQPLGSIFARNLDDALALYFAQCQSDAHCREQLGDTRAQLDALLARLRQQPVQVRYRDASTHEETTTTLTADMLAGLVRMYAYMPQAAALLPKLIHDAHAGRYEGITALSQLLSKQVGESMAMGMQFSVICAEDAGSFNASEADHNTVLGAGLTKGMAAMCDVWPRGAVPADFRTPLTGKIPVLAISGEFDPVTPPRYGDEAIAKLDHAIHLVLKGQGHNVIGAGCMPKVFAQFVETAFSEPLQSSCLDNLSAVPPFTSFNGPNP